MLQGHGDDRHRYARPIVADFSTNVWYGGEPAGLKEHLFGHWAVVNRYPEALAESLAEQVAGHYGLAPEQVLISSGTTESIYLVAQAFRGQRTTIITPTFAEYEDACRLHGHHLTFLPWEALTADTSLSTDLLFLCNPNNPTGSVFPELKALLTRNPQTLVVLDEAFIEFAQALPSAVPLLSRFENMLILRSLTKVFAIPGLRLGYVLGSAAAVARLRAGKFPWSVNALAVEAGKFIFQHLPHLQLPLAQLLAERAEFSAQVAAVAPFIRVQPSHTHYFLAETTVSTAADLKQFLVAEHGLLIRDASNFRGLGPGHFRLATLRPAQNQLLLAALAEWNPPC